MNETDDRNLPAKLDAAEKAIAEVSDTVDALLMRAELKVLQTAALELKRRDLEFQIAKLLTKLSLKIVALNPPPPPGERNPSGSNIPLSAPPDRGMDRRRLSDLRQSVDGITEEMVDEVAEAGILPTPTRIKQYYEEEIEEPEEIRPQIKRGETRTVKLDAEHALAKFLTRGYVGAIVYGGKTFTYVTDENATTIEIQIEGE